MSNPLHVLIVEDSASDAAMVVRQLRKAGYDVHDERVETADQMRAALDKQTWDVVIADYRLPQFDAPAALALLQGTGLDIPFIVVSGTVGEDTAVATMKAGAHDYLMKDRLARLPPAVEREIREAQTRRERKRAEEALGRRAAQLALINEVGSQIAAVLELEGVLDRAAHLVQEGFGYHHVALFTLDREQGVLVMRATAGDFAHLFPSDHRLKLGQGVVGWAGQHGKTLLANDVDAEPRYVNLYPGVIATRSELSVPIRVGGEVVGVLDIQSPQANAFDENDVMVKETLADQIAVAIENARLYEAVQRELAERRRVEEEIRRRNRELTLLNHVIAASATSAEPEAILEVACRELAQAFDVPHATACILNQEKTAAVVVAEYSSAGPGQRRAEGWPSALNTTIFVGDNPTLQHLLTRKTPLVVTGTQSDRDLASLHEAMNERGVAPLLGLPLVIKGEVVGSLNLDDSEPHPFPAEEVSLAWSVADQVSGTLARAQADQERQRLEEQYHQAQKMEAVGQLTAGIAHDFNNLLTAINGFAELTQFELSPDDPLQKSLSKILDSGRRAADLVRQLLAFSRKQILEPKVLDLNQVVAETDMMLQRIIGEHIELKTSLAPGLWPVEVDPTQIGQVIVNLAVNAQDAMPKGGSLTIETANVVLDEDYVADHLGAEPGEYVLLSVSDTGIGMSREVKAHIFEPFFTTKERGRGTGLGLATVYGIVKQSGGHIWVYSEEEVGTTFKIYLPRAEGAARPLTRPEMREPLPGGEETILLVEDDAGVRDLARHVLQSQGYTLLEAENGQEALHLVARHPGVVHLLLTDVVMPGMSGRDLAEQLAQAHPNLKTLFMSGYADDMIAHHGVLDPGTPFLQKPFSLMALARKVRAVLDS
jgi:signal transduction histidine kinase/DNA-binding response OmpR family regulator